MTAMSAPRRVAMITPGFPPSLGGVEIVAGRLAAELARNGHHVDVITHFDSRHPQPEATSGHLRVHRYRSWSGSSRFPMAPGIWGHLMRHRHYDVLHAHSFHALPALAAALSSDLPLVFTPHYHAVGHTPLARLYHRGYDPMARLIFERATSVICVSAAEAELLEADYPSCARRITVIPNGIDTALSTPAEPFPVSRLLALTGGRLEAYKQVDLAIRAVAHLGEDVELVVTGDGPEAHRLSSLVEELDIGHRVRLTGRINLADVRRWQLTASVVLTLSRHEAFGMALLEGLSAGASVVASDIPAHREVGANHPADVAYVDPAASSLTVADAIRHMIGRPRVSLDPGILTWQQVGAATADVYAEACRTPSRRRAAAWRASRRFRAIR